MAPLGAQHQDELADRPSVAVNYPVLVLVCGDRD
jgi:hypothetical protein